MIDRTIVLETARIRLEPLHLKHLPSLMERCNDEALWEFTFGQNPFDSEGAAKAWFADANTTLDQLAFAIIDKSTGLAIGSTRYADIQPQHHKLEIGWTFIAQSHWRSHVNSECKFLLFQYAFETWGANRIQLKGEAINLRSRAAMERIGATYEGTLRAFRVHPTGVVRDTSFYSIIAPEWPAVKARLLARAETAIAAQPNQLHV